MNILTNFIPHKDCCYSFYALFEKRLGHKLYIPKNLDEFIKFNDLSKSSKVDYHKKDLDKQDIKEIPILYTEFNERLIDIEQFLDMRIDMIVISSGKLEVPFYNLAKKYKPNSIFIRQIANLGEKPNICKNILRATKTIMPEGIKYFTYHPEHPPRFNYIPHNGEKTIKSFSNYLRNRARDATTWDEAKSRLKEFTFSMHGCNTDDGFIAYKDLHKEMQKSMFIWHTKAAGGGGFVCREALSCGRPLIVKKKYTYVHKTLASDYLEDGINCIDISKRGLENTIKTIREWSHPDNYESRCKQVLKSFKKNINFEKEAQGISQWLTRLNPVGKE